MPALASQNKSRHETTIPRKELSELSDAIKASPIYQRTKEKEIGSMIAQLHHTSDIAQKWHISFRLSECYRLFNTDSAMRYASNAREIAMRLDDSHRLKTDILLVKVLSTAGIFTQAQYLFNLVGEKNMTPDIKLDYWMAGRILYSYMRTYVDGQDHFHELYTRQYFQFDDSLIRHLPANNLFREFIISERLVNEGNYRSAQQHLERLLQKISPGDNLYSMATFQLAEVYKNQSKETQYATLLAQSAVCDIKACVKEGLALPALAYWLYENGELNEAFAYINFALEDAMNGNARMRMVSVAQMVPIIDEAYREKINSSRDEMMIYFLLVTFLLIISAILLFILLRQSRRSRANAKKLAETKRRQDSYIGNFIGLYSSYADRLDRLTKLVSLKLSTGQTAELKKMIDSGKFVDEDNDDVFKIFDHAFLDIYPDFITHINMLLRPEEQIVVKNPGTLTPELRIYALVKLGVNESNRIAQILHYSTNTVYAYRNRMRNKAISRDSFDSDVLKIGSDNLE